ncbi:MAG: cell division ATPase MinD [Candidatus Hodarchaeaceae archaeon]|nr:cell division ATPase MinD [Candidatus Hodarchaeaceae archaeon]
MSKVYTITSGKGGVGKTTAAANLGVCLGQLGKKTLVIDADLAMGGIATILGLSETYVTLHEALGGKVSAEKAIYSAHGIDVLPSGPSIGGFLGADPNKLGSIVEKLVKGYDYILIDAPPGLNKYSLAPIKVADEILLIVTPDPPAIEAAAKLHTVAEVMDAKIGGVVVNRARKSSFLGRLRGSKLMKNAEIEGKLKAQILGTIEEDPAVIESTNLKKPVIVYKPKSPASKALRGLAAKLTL